MSRPLAVCEYYCEVGARDRLTPTASSKSKALFDRRESAAQQLFTTAFEPSVLRRVPEDDKADLPFPPEVAMFCFGTPLTQTRVHCALLRSQPQPARPPSFAAHGCRVVTPEEAAANAIPVVTSFVLTTADRSRMYGACIVWYECLAADVVGAFLDDA